MPRPKGKTMKNSFGNALSVTLFGESHGEAIGAVIDGLSPGIKICEDYINKMMDLDNKYESIINNTAITVVNNSTISVFFRKMKALLSARIELQ